MLRFVQPEYDYSTNYNTQTDQYQYNWIKEYLKKNDENT